MKWTDLTESYGCPEAYEKEIKTELIATLIEKIRNDPNCSPEFNDCDNFYRAVMKILNDELKE